VGVDSNDVAYYASRGRGKVIVSIEANGKAIYRSPLLHEGLAAVPVDVAFNGASDFTLRVSGVEQGTEWDQADFADAKVTLPNGQAIDLGDLPIAPLQANYNADPPFSFVLAGEKSSNLLKNWSSERTSRQLDGQRTEYTTIYRDLIHALEIRFQGIEY